MHTYLLSVSFKFKLQIRGKTGNGDTKFFEIMVIVAGSAANQIPEMQNFMFQSQLYQIKII